MLTSHGGGGQGLGVCATSSVDWEGREEFLQLAGKAACEVRRVGTEKPGGDQPSSIRGSSRAGSSREGRRESALS